MSVPPEQTARGIPAKALLNRIDIGLVTGICAVFISFLALIVANMQTKMAQETQKASVLPIIQVDMGYTYKTSPSLFEINLTNSGVGIAYIQRVRPTINGEPVEKYLNLQNAVMNGRMRSNATLTELPATGYLPAGQSLTPWSYTWGSSLNGRGEIEAYLRGDFGPPMQGVDIEVCYCSVFDDCWLTAYSNTGKPKPVRSCGRDDAQEDYFQTYIDQRAAPAASEES